MPRGVSIHIGLNRVDPDQYGGWSGDLNACEFDAQDMAAIAAGAKYESSKMLLSPEATADALLGELRDAAGSLAAGDVLLLTYSGHGGQVPDLDGQEEDQQDETWVLYDRQVLDDELYSAYSAFQPGVRIAVLSDSCHSGTVTRVGPPIVAGPAAGAHTTTGQVPTGARSRAMPPALALRDFTARREMYAALKKDSGSPDPHEIDPCVVLVSGCADNQVSLDGTHNGLFTATLLTVWNGGLFRGGYQRLRNQVSKRMPESQSPQLSVVGTRDPAFLAQKPFTV